MKTKQCEITSYLSDTPTLLILNFATLRTMTTKSFNDLKKNLKKDFSALKSIKVAVLADSASQLYVQALKGYGYEADYNLNVYEADYDQIDRQIFDVDSALYKADAEYIIMFPSVQKLLKRFYKLSTQQKNSFAAEYISYTRDLVAAINKKTKAKIILFNFQEINDSVFGNFSNKLSSSFVYQLRKINLELMDLARENAGVFINDFASLQNNFGSSFITEQKIYINTDTVFSLDFLPHIAKNTVDIISAVAGKFKKCLILDLDNTTWGGVIGDDGIENIQVGDLGVGKAFTELQLWAKQLKERGIILAVCSKNTENIAKEPFEKHPDMVLRLDDIAVFIANWENKVDNIRHIQTVLNVGFDSMVFLDDNAFERNMVRSEIKDISVPELPEDPAEYLPYLRTLNLFETASFTEEDSQRTKQYQEEAKRVSFQKSYANEDEFLKSLNMVSEISAFNKFNTPRVAQLSQRSNQFNLRTVRYTEDSVQQVASSKEHFTFSFTLKDTFGDYGLISFVILQKKNQELFIDTWLMSCRVLKRGMENFALHQLVQCAKENGFEKLIGEYIPTAKNEMVKDHYKNLGFTEKGSQWELIVKDFKEKTVYIYPKQI